MKERISKLLSIKSIVTILFVVVTLALCAYRVITQGESIPEQIWTILATIIAFYFGTVAEKNGYQDNKAQEQDNKAQKQEDNG